MSGDDTDVEGKVAAHLAGLQLADSLFPAGLYSQSFGVEAFVTLRRVSDPAGVETLCADLLARQIAPADGVAAAWAWRAAARGQLATALATDRRLEAAKPVASQRQASVRAGRAIVAVGEALQLGGIPAEYAEEVTAEASPGHHAIAMALLSHSQGIGPAPAVAGELYATAAAMLSAALRLGMMDHLRVQAALRRLRPHLSELTATALETPLDELGAFAPAADAAALSHQHANRKLFAT